MISFTEDKLPSRTLIFSNHVNSSSCCFRWLCSCSCCFFFCFCLGRFERDRRRGSCQAHSVVLLGLVRRQNVVNKSYIVHRRSQCPTVILAALSLRNPHALAVLCPCSLRGLSVLSPCSLRDLSVISVLSPSSLRTLSVRAPCSLRALYIISWRSLRALSVLSPCSHRALFMLSPGCLRAYFVTDHVGRERRMRAQHGARGLSGCGKGKIKESHSRQSYAEKSTSKQS